MPTFIYRAISPLGKAVEGEIEGASARDALHELKVIGYKVEALFERPARLPLKAVLLSYFNSVSLLELALFTRQLAILVSNGINLLEGLEGIRRQKFSKALTTAIDETIKGLENGAPLSGSMRTRPDVFSPVYTNLIRAGEVSGQLDSVLRRLAVFLERDLALVRKIRSAMAYPVLVFILSVALVLFMVTVIFPQFMGFFSGLNLKLPLTSRILMWVTTTLQNPWVVAGLVLGLPLVSYRLHYHFSRTANGNRQWATMMLAIPLVGRVQSQVILARFCRTLSTLLEAGVPQMACLEVAAQTLGNRIVIDQVQEAARALRDEGMSLAGALSQQKFFPRMVVQLLRVGEEVGKIPLMLDKLADNYEMDLEISVGRVVAMLEPLMMLFMGAVVGYVLLAIFLPVYSLLDAI